MKTNLPCVQSKTYLNWLPQTLKSTTMLFLFTILFFSSKTFAQLPEPFICDGNCTSSDVRVVSAYISGPNNMPINCDDANPFDNAELHLIINSNTQRVGISMGSTLNITDANNNVTSSFNFATCFADVQLNNGSNNNLVYPLGNTLAGVQCGPGFTLSNVFISWGTGNTDFCNASTNPQCPATPAKCRYKANEVIPVEVKLEVDFSWLAGVCANGGNSLSLDFAPSVITQQNLTYPLTFTWDFGDGSPTEQTTAQSASDADLASAHITHTYATAGTYSVKLVGSDASPFFSKTAIHSIAVIACCNVAAPVLSVVNDCGSSTISAKDADGNLISADKLTWSNGATGNPIQVTTTDAVTAFVTDGDCTSDVSNSVTPAPKTIPAAPVLSVIDNCGSSDITANDADGNLISADVLTWSNSANGNPINVTTTTAVTATITSGGCTSDASNSVTPAPKTVPTVSAGDDVSICNGSSTTLTASGASSYSWSPADGLSATTGSSVTANPTSTTTYTVTGTANNSCSNTDDVTLTVNPLPTVAAGDDVAICNGSSTTLTATGATSYSWSPADGLSATTGSSVTANPTSTTTYTVTGTDGNSCSNTNDVKVTVNPLPTVAAGDDVSICNGGSTTLTATGATSYSWSPATGLSATTGSSVTANPTSTTTYTVTGTDGNSCSNTDDVKVTVNPVPVCTISGTSSVGVGQTITFSTTSNANYSYQWSLSNNTAGAAFVGATNGSSVKVSTTTGGTNVGYTLSVKVTDNSYTTKCNSTCTYPVTVNTGNGYYTYTQGYYSSTGTSCTPAGGKKGSLALVQYALSNMPGMKLYLGKPGHSFTALYADAATIVKIMPGGTTPSNLAADYDLATNTSTPAPPLDKKGKLVNVLLSQAITLSLNESIQGENLKAFVLHGGYLTTQKGDLSTCPITKVILCSKDASSISSMKLTTNTTLMAKLEGQTVDSLLRMASNALGGTLPAGVTYSDINNAVDVINRSFDGGRFFLGYYNTAQTCSTISSAIANSRTNISLNASQLVKAYPNPYNNIISFNITASVSGRALLEVYDLNGKKLAVVFDGTMNAGTVHTINFEVPAGIRVPMMYQFTIGDKTSHGLLMPEK